MFPLAGALLLPRGQMPLNIFEPRYLAMVDDALRDGHRLIGMIQPDVAHTRQIPTSRRCFASAASGASPSSPPKPATGRYILELDRHRALRGDREISAPTAYRQCQVDYCPFLDDFIARKGEDEVDRDAVLTALSDFLKANNLKTDWEGIENAPNEALVNALAMMSPYGPPEKQALLEAPDLKRLAEILIAVTEMDLAKKRTMGDPGLQ